MCIKSHLTNGLIVLFTGVALTIIVGVVGWITVPQIVVNISSKLMVLEEDNFVWKIWSDPAFPIYTDFYIFNCTNAEEVLKLGEKPNVTELGPYSYREYRHKNIQPLTDEVHVFYQEDRLYYFSSNTSGPGLSLNDKITVPNPIYMTVSLLLGELENVVPTNIYNKVISISNDLLTSRGESVFMTITVDELIFKGWSLQNYIDLVKAFLDDPLLCKVLCPIIDSILPPNATLSDDIRFGLFSTKNNSNDGLFKVNRGREDPLQFDSVEAWGKTPEKIDAFLPYWLNPSETNPEYECNTIRGTDGTVFPSGFDQTERLYIYQTDLCRVVYLIYNNDETYDGFPARRFILPKEILQSATENPENGCFCMDENDEGKCPGTGAMYLGTCYESAPVIGSGSHFFDGDQKYIHHVNGLAPNISKHQTYVLLEARTNVLLQAAKRVQLNLDVRKTALDATFDLGERRYFIPMMHYEENVQADEETLNTLYLIDIADIVVWALLAVGIFLIFVGAGLIAFHYKSKTKGVKV